jgi:hypothetical protein
MSQTLEEKRIAELTERIEDFLCEGEEYLIRCQEGQTEVIPGPEVNPIRRNHEELYGFLLSLNQQLAEAASLPRWIVRLLFLSLILGLHLDWFSGLALPIDLARLQSWWVYALIFLFGFAVNSLIKELSQHHIYASRRSDLLRLLNESGMPKYRLLTQIEGDSALSEASLMLKRDHAQEARF